MESLLTSAYAAFFIFLIHKMRFFECEALSKRFISGIFILKIFFGVLLYTIYTHYYNDRSTADIFKYFDDSKLIFDSLITKPLDFLKIVSGIGNDTPYFEANYYHKMSSWHKGFDSTLYNDSHTIIRFNALVRIFSLEYFHVHTVFICFISIIGLTGLYKAFYPYMTTKNKELIFSIFFIPSVLFWGSGVLKEGIAFFGMGLLIYHLLLILRTGFQIRSFIICIAMLVVLVFTKFYLLVAIVPPLLALTWIYKSNYKIPVLKFLIVAINCLLISVNVKYILPQYDLLNVLSFKQKDFISMAKGGIYLYDSTNVVVISADEKDVLIPISENKFKIKNGVPCYYLDIKSDFKDTLFAANSNDTIEYTMLVNSPRSGSIIHVGKLEPNLLSFISNAPEAVLNMLIQPHFFNADSALSYIAALENIFILILMILGFAFMEKEKKEINIFWFCIFIFLIHSIVIGMVSPVTGAIVRYKAPALPFLLIAFFILLDTKKLYSKFFKHKNTE